MDMILYVCQLLFFFLHTYSNEKYLTFQADETFIGLSPHILRHLWPKMI